jgi:hypothetical protein
MTFQTVPSAHPTARTNPLWVLTRAQVSAHDNPQAWQGKCCGAVGQPKDVRAHLGAGIIKLNTRAGRMNAEQIRCKCLERCRGRFHKREIFRRDSCEKRPIIFPVSTRVMRCDNMNAGLRIIFVRSVVPIYPFRSSSLESRNRELFQLTC